MENNFTFDKLLNDKNQLMIIGIGLFVIYFMFFRKREMFGGLGKQAKIDTATCSKACCYQQYPVPFNTVVDPNVPDPSKYEKSNFMCNYGSGSGCVCISKKQKNWLGSRAGNTRMCLQ
jgi:hypothetical protein